MSEQWPSAGRIVHVSDPGPNDEPGCRAAVIVRLVSEPGPDADVQLHVFPAPGDAEHIRLPWADRAAVHRDEWHWPEYVGPHAAPIEQR